METKEPGPGGVHLPTPNLARGTAKWEQRRDRNAAELAVLRETQTKPTSVTALRRALAKYSDERQELMGVVVEIAGKLDHLHTDLLALHEHAGIWRESCGTPQPRAARPAAAPRRKHTPQARRRRR